MADTAGRGVAAPVRSVSSFSVTPLDGMLLLMALIWGGNFAVMKAAIRNIPPFGFNFLRLVLASALFLVPLAAAPWPRFTRGEWWRMWLLGFTGHFLYQVCFLGGLARTSVANSALILGCVPIAVALVTAAASRVERVTRLHWAGAVLSTFGIYLAVGRGVSISGQSHVGDLLTFGAVWCWAGYTVGARPLLERHSPLVVTAYTMAMGTVLYAPIGIRDLIRLDWRLVAGATWLALFFSAALSLCVCYLIWYTAVQRLGGARTSMYQNLVPIAAMAIAAISLNEPLGVAKIAGAIVVLTGVAITRMKTFGSVSMPPEE